MQAEPVGDPHNESTDKTDADADDGKAPTRPRHIGARGRWCAYEGQAGQEG